MFLSSLPTQRGSPQKVGGISHLQIFCKEKEVECAPAKQMRHLWQLHTITYVQLCCDKYAVTGKTLLLTRFCLKTKKEHKQTTHKNQRNCFPQCWLSSLQHGTVCARWKIHTHHQRWPNNFTGNPYCNINSKSSHNTHNPHAQLHSEFPYPAALL